MGYLKEVNIKYDMPDAGLAVRRATYALENGRQLGAGAVKLIHGYGSSGKGGKIRVAIRKELEKCQKEGQIAFFITGENFSIFDENTRKILYVDKSIREDKDLNRHNNGVTFVVFQP